MNISQNLQLFRELITCSRDIYFWTYNNNLDTIFSNSPNDIVFDLLFSLECSREKLLSYFQTNDRPVIITNSIGLIWIADAEKDETGQSFFIHMIGPAFFDDVSTQALETSLGRLNLSVATKRGFLSTLKTLPVVSYVHFIEYGQMLHYCIYNEKLTFSKMNLLNIPATVITPQNNPAEKFRHGTYASEQAILALIEEGNLNYREKQDKLNSMGNVGKLSNGDSLRQSKNNIIIFTALAARAAMKGGLDPETAYSLSDFYIQSAESCTAFEELTLVSHKMQNDFIQRVHDFKLNTGISSQILKCCNYIHLHIAEKIILHDLALQMGYSQNYLCKRFKQETGQNIRDYINAVRIEKAKEILLTQTYTIQEISEQLHFSSPSYFCKLFKETVGCTPSVYQRRPVQDSQSPV